MANGRELAAVFKLRDEASTEFEHIKGHIEGLDAKLGGISGNAVAAGLALAGTMAAAIALTKAAFDLGEAFDSASDSITIKSGAMGDTLAQLQTDFDEVVKNVPTNFENAATAIGLLHARTGETGEALQELSEQMLNMSRLTGSDVAENVRQVTRLFGDWSVSTEEQSLTMDKLFRAAQMSGTSISELSQRVVQFGAPMRQLGIDMDSAISLFAKWEKEGVNVETVAGTMRMALAKMAEVGLDPKETFERLINTIHDMEDPVEATALAMEVFGKRGGADMAAAIREGRFAVDDYKKSLEDAGGAIQTTADLTDDAKQAMEKSWNELKIAAKPVVTEVFEAINKILETAVPLMKGFADALKDVGEGFKAMKEGKVTWQEVAAAAMGIETRPGEGRPRTDLSGITLNRPGGLPALPSETPEVPSAAANAGGPGLTSAEIAALRKDKEEEREAARIAREAEAERKREAAAAVREAERILKEQERIAAREAEVAAQRDIAIREAGHRRADAINEATDAAADAIAKANEKADEQIAQAEAQFAKEREIADERKRLQEEIQRGLDAEREKLAARQRGTADSRADADLDFRRGREGEDIGIRRDREDADFAARQVQRSAQTRQAEEQDQQKINAARFAGDSRAVIAAMLAAEQRKKAVKDQTAIDLAALELKRQREDEDLARRHTREDEDVARARGRRADDLAQAKADAAELAAVTKELNAPLEAFNQNLLEDTLAEKISGYAKAREDAINAANTLLTNRTAAAESQFAAGVERANNIGTPATVINQNFYNYNSGIQSSDAIEEAAIEMFQDAADALRME